MDSWRKLVSPNDWLVTPETAQLLQHWRHHAFQSLRPFFCQLEARQVAVGARAADVALDTNNISVTRNLNVGPWLCPSGAARRRCRA